MRKARYFDTVKTRREARALCGFEHHKGENVFRFMFSDALSAGLMRSENRKHNRVSPLWC